MLGSKQANLTHYQWCCNVYADIWLVALEITRDHRCPMCPWGTSLLFTY